MLEWYILTVLGFALGFDQHRTILFNIKVIPNLQFRRTIFDIAGWMGGVCTLGILIGGFFLTIWWWPLLAILFGTGTNFMGRKFIPMKFRWIASIISTSFGIFAATVLLTLSNSGVAFLLALF